MALVVLAWAAIFVAGRAQAGGQFIPGRGARALGRAGSFVAGADDGGAMVYNPAGLAEIPRLSLLLDVGLVLQRVSYARVDSGGNPQPSVDGSIDLNPIPTVVLTWKPQRAQFMTLAFGIWDPYLASNSYPESGPQRYSLISQKGTAGLIAEVAAAFKVHERLYLGAGFQVFWLHFKNLSMLSACSQLSCAPEDPAFDSLTQITTNGVAPSGNLGATVVWKKLRLGLSVQLPFWFRSTGDVQSRLPTDPMFANAKVVGTDTSVAFNFPVIVRLGGELRPHPRVRVELGLDYEAWSMQDRFTITPKGVFIDGVPGLGRYYLGPQHIARDLRDTVAVHLGGEFEVLPSRLTLRGGYLFETSATPDETLSVLAPDGIRNLVTLGFGVRVGPVRIDLGYGHLFTTERTVTNSRAAQIDPIAPSMVVAVGNGRYQVATDILSVGLDARF